MSTDAMIGTISMFAGNFAPRGYALCQGQLLSISQNTALFSIIGTYYGGNGQTTFALPDLRGRSPVGVGNGPGLTPISIGQQGGTSAITLTMANLPPHSHAVNCDNTGQTSTAPSGLIPGLSDDRTTSLPVYSGAAANAVMNPQTVGVSGNSFPLDGDDPYLGINFIICTQGVFPSRN
jgi:microcystin-dependent protein